MSWGGASNYVHPETGEFLFPCEVASEELAMWDEILQKLGQKNKEPAETIH